MNIAIKSTNHLKEFLHGLHSKPEDMMFSIILKTPERLIPRFLMEWLDRYTTNRINQLHQELIKDKWKSMYLEKAIDEISKDQQADK